MEEDGQKLPPAGIFVVLIIVAFALFTIPNSSPLLRFIGFLALVGALGVSGYAFFLAKSEGTKDTVNWLTTIKESDKGYSRSRTPKKLKEWIKERRANGKCEYCGQSNYTLEAHHILPKSEDGADDPRNLIALCPNCHSRADRGEIPKSELMKIVENKKEEKPKWE
ncbi:MAG: Restriction endonuclease HNH family [Candidatus Methanohalarchaeum thermophilum]|uniref:Restriction endonuclease HNH family n=1 Tax=Methanohalarchaeum thermophilum TaxID=1903181 RepID=A0A1Q6DWC2_METT1|nr:MAG: Restriction endonuclease HNH family [Candidatus Methanohalarchaeum thermophilum]